MEHYSVGIVLFFAFFLVLISFAYQITKKYSFVPYTLLLLVLGLVTQYASEYLPLHFNISLSHEIIYYILLPILLYESAAHIKLHQFRLQFKTISFLATFGLLISVFTIGFFLSRFAGLSFNDALLFGAIISATDPIAVISMFKSLGAPRRLALVADGESMLNDATGVIVFRLVSAFVLAGGIFTSTDLVSATGQFLYVFVGSIIFGAIFGYLGAKLLSKFPHDRIIITSLTFVFALGSFVFSEILFHFSGVISTVIAALFIGNYGRTAVSSRVNEFEEELLEYFAFLCVSLVFFFATYTLDVSIFVGNLDTLFYVILSTLIARALGVYLSCYLSNRLPFFSDEPNIPLSWQHILNVGGLRGVIPLVLVYSLPQDYVLYDEMLVFTLGTFLFTLFVNTFAVQTILVKLGLHKPPKEEEILYEEKTIFDLEEAQDILQKIDTTEIDPQIIKNVSRDLTNEAMKHKKHLEELASTSDLEKSLALQVLEVERNSLEKLFQKGYINETVFYEFEAELDLQEDAIEFKEAYKGRAILPGGKIDSEGSYRERLSRMRKYLRKFPFIAKLFKLSEKDIITDRISLLKARIATSKDVSIHLERIKTLFGKKDKASILLSKLIAEHTAFIKENSSELDQMAKSHPKIYSDYQKTIAYSFLHQD